MKERIAKLMELEQLSPTRFAMMIGIQPSVVSHILNGRNKPSLEVVQKILSAFQSINPDWLILGSGGMYREEMPSRQASLFDIKPEITNKTTDYEQKNEGKFVPSTEPKQEKTPDSSVVLTNVQEKIVKKITIYYSDKTFEEFLPNQTE